MNALFLVRIKFLQNDRSELHKIKDKYVILNL